MHKSNAVIVELDTLLDFLEKSIEDPQSRWEQLRDFIATQKAAQHNMHSDAATPCANCSSTHQHIVCSVCGATKPAAQVM